jgi:hypothetical protein
MKTYDNAEDHAMKRKAKAEVFLKSRAFYILKRRPVVDLADAIKAVKMMYGVNSLYSKSE